jgi:hypothetical protein
MPTIDLHGVRVKMVEMAVLKEWLLKEVLGQRPQ